ncbi:MAG: hypothetical protein R2747_02700 [Pyrinomonadaceae bacterium]
MKPNEVIYHIRQDRNLAAIWKKLTREEKTEVLTRMERQKPIDLERVLLEVKTRQYRLF